ncbi:type 1 glutamine amidotransferase [Candidatus Margulisiibacteriota bacterium]
MRKVGFVLHTSVEGPGLFEDIFSELGWEIKKYNYFENQILLEHVDECDIYFLMGGPQSVGNNLELKNEYEFIKKLIKEHIPCVGICLGAQMIAHVLGAKVYKADNPEFGWEYISLTDEGVASDIAVGFPGELKVFQWHEDTFDIPEGCELLALSEKCRNQWFKYHDYIYGLQFHFEMRKEDISRLLQVVKEDKGPEIEDLEMAIMEEMDESVKENEKVCRMFVENLLEALLR